MSAHPGEALGATHTFRQGLPCLLVQQRLIVVQILARRPTALKEIDDTLCFGHEVCQSSQPSRTSTRGSCIDRFAEDISEPQRAEAECRAGQKVPASDRKRAVFFHGFTVPRWLRRGSGWPARRWSRRRVPPPEVTDLACSRRS